MSLGYILIVAGIIIELALPLRRPVTWIYSPWPSGWSYVGLSIGIIGLLMVERQL